MEIQDFYKIFADMEDAQEARLKKFQSVMAASIAENKNEQKRDLAALSNNIAYLSQQLNSINTKNGAVPPEIKEEIRQLRLDIISLKNSNADTQRLYFWALVVLIASFFGSIEYSLYNLPEQTAEQLYQTYYAKQATEPKQPKRAKAK